MAEGNLSELEQLKAENRRLQEKLDRFEKLHEVLRVVGGTLEVDKVIELMIDQTLQLCDADQGSVLLLDPSGHQEAKTLIRQDEAGDVKLDHFLNMLFAGWVSRHKAPLFTRDLKEEFGSEFMKDKYLDVRSAICMPLGKPGDPLGVLNLIRLRDKPPFSNADFQLLKVLSVAFAQYIHHASLHRELFNETVRLRQEVQDRYAVHGIIGRSEPVQQLYALLDKVIPTDTRVLIQGESGTGKELIAKVIHFSGPRKDAPFIAVDCGALPANLLEGELFGYLKGAFTGAQKDKKGLIEAANGGTLFLDEIANMPLEIQSKFLRAIQESEIRPLGSTSTRKVDVRIIAAASADLKEMIQAGTFREDLFYRLNVITLALPPLRDRSGDVAVLAGSFLEKIADRHKKPLSSFSAAAMAHMEMYDWPGNIRQLENVVERMVVLAEPEAKSITEDLLPWEIRPQPAGESERPSGLTDSQTDIRRKKNDYEKMMMVEALARNNWNQSAAARDLGISERTVRYKMQKFNIVKPQ